MKVAIIGMGFVGLSLAVFLSSKNVKVFGIENNKSKLSSLKHGKPPFFEPDLKKTLLQSIEKGNLCFFGSINNVFDKIDLLYVTVGTPTIHGKIDLRTLKSVITNIGKLLKKSRNSPLIIIKSTIAPGTTQKIIIPLLKKYSKKILGKNLFLVTNPEFIREGRAIYDQTNPHVIVIGSADNKSKKLITNFYKKIYPSKVSRVLVNFPTSEMIKYSNNAFLATKITFINTISNLCQKIPDTNVDEIAKCMGMDPRISPEFLKAGPGYGGSCFPKDLESFISVYKEHGLQPVLFSSVKKVNSNQIVEVIKIMKQKIKKINGKSVAILGLAFKENSDDVRESTSISLIKKLLPMKCKIKVHDPLAIQNTRKIFKNKISYFDDYRKCIEKTDCAILMTPWIQYKKIHSRDIKKMNHPLIIDTRRILQNSKLNADYNALGINSLQ